MEMSWRLQRAVKEERLGALSDEELYNLAYKNTSAFELLMLRYEGYIFRYCRYLAKDEEDAKDLFQESVWKVYLMAKRGQKVENFKSYLRKLIVNLFIDKYRKKKKVVSLTDVEENGYQIRDDSFVRDLEAQESVDILKHYLSPEERVVLVLRFEEGLSYAEISKELGVSEAAVRQKISRIKKKLLSKLS